jgi:UDP-3-O-acyl-N-acetylglucosamine deacetylase
LTVGASTYELARGGGVELEVTIDFDDERLAKRASWAGDPEDFFARIAAARTFGFEHELAHLLARGLASHVTPESVVVIAPSGVLFAGAPFSADEPARHKLLDLIGDLYLYGGPPRGRVAALRPGHAATHAVMRRALAEGLVARDGG